MNDTGRFRIRFGLFRGLLTLLGTGPGSSYVEVRQGAIRVTMGWAFRASIPLPSVRRIYKDRDMWRGIGVHGWRGEWLVNGSVSDIVTIEIDPPARARVIGVPVRLSKLHVSLEDSDGFLAALADTGKVT